MAGLCADFTEKSAAVVESDSVFGREPLRREKASAETGTVRRLLGRRTTRKERFYRLGKQAIRTTRGGAIMLHGRRLLVSFFIVLAAVSLPTISRAQKPALLVLQGGTLIDATGRPPLEDAVIVIEGER